MRPSRLMENSPGNIAAPLPAAQPALACLGPVPNENSGGKAAAPGDVAEPPRRFGGLVLPSAEIAMLMKRQRNHQTILAIRYHRKVPCHQRCQERGQLQPFTTFESQDQLVRDVVKMEAGSDHRQRWRVHPAGGAQAGAVGKAPTRHALMRQDNADEIACRADHPDWLVRSGKCSVNDALLHRFSLAV